MPLCGTKCLIFMWQQRPYDVFPSGQGSAVQASGSEGKGDPAEDLQRDYWLDWARHTCKTLSVLTLILLHCVCCCSNILTLSSQFYLPLPAHFISHSFHISYHLFHFIWFGLSFDLFSLPLHLQMLKSTMWTWQLWPKVTFSPPSGWLTGGISTSAAPAWTGDPWPLYQISTTALTKTLRHSFTSISLYKNRGCGTDYWHSEVALYQKWTATLCVQIVFVHKSCYTKGKDGESR